MSDTGSALWTSWFLNWFLSRFFCFVCFSYNLFKKTLSFTLFLTAQLFVDWFDQIASLDLFICCEECIFLNNCIKFWNVFLWHCWNTDCHTHFFCGRHFSNTRCHAHLLLCFFLLWGSSSKFDKNSIQNVFISLVILFLFHFIKSTKQCLVHFLSLCLKGKLRYMNVLKIWRLK